MNGWNVQLRVVCLLSVATMAGCGGERRSAAAPAVDTAVVAGLDTAATRVAETTAVVTSPQAPPVARTTPAKKPAPKPKAPTPAAPAPSDTSTAAVPQPADTAASATPLTGQANAPLRDQYHRAPLDTVAQLVYEGWKQFNLNCARCHGEDVQGTTIAPHLIVSLRPDGPINTKELFVQTVCAGRPEKGMPSWCALGMDMDKINQIYAYVKGRSDAKIHPGRPAVKAGG
jgi:mono/diheme cytochrome c family protein